MTPWPATLPLPQLETSGVPTHSTIANSATSALIERRRRFVAAGVQLSVSWVLDIAQMDAFEAFFTTDLDQGAALFQVELRHPETSALSLWVCRFLGGYSQSYQEGLWFVESTLDLHYIQPTAGAALVGWTDFYVASGESDGAPVPLLLVGNHSMAVTQ